MWPGIHLNSAQVRGLGLVLSLSVSLSTYFSPSLPLSLCWRPEKKKLASLASTPWISQIRFSVFCDRTFCHVHLYSILLQGRLEMQLLYNVMEISHLYGVCQLGKAKQSNLYWRLLLNVAKGLTLGNWEKWSVSQNLEKPVGLQGFCFGESIYRLTSDLSHPKFILLGMNKLKFSFPLLRNMAEIILVGYFCLQRRTMMLIRNEGFP